MRILIVDDEARYRELYEQVLGASGFETRTASTAEEALCALDEAEPHLVVSDVRMPGASGLELLQKARKRYPALPFLLVTAYADVRDAVKALKLGAVDYLAKPVDLDELEAAVRDALGVRAEETAMEVPPAALEGIVARSTGMQVVLRDAYRIAPSHAHVLLTGESGTGKEVVARFIHRSSPRNSGPLVVVNCAAIPMSLLASELFGHEKGAFTGASTKRRGRFREAHGGTLFLDEIGDMPLELQPALLRVIENSRLCPVGSDREVEVDYRLLAATNRDLPRDIAAGRFREDLYYRLNVIAIDLPPLRERTEDILPLARRFLAEDPSDARRLSRAAASALLAHAWPGNVRELANAMERARLLCHGDVIVPEHLPPALRETAARLGPAPRASDPTDPKDVRTLEETEVEAIRHALRTTGGNRTRAAELLGVSRRGLIYKLKRFGIG